MVSRYDVVLAALPLLAASGIVVQRVASVLESLAGVGGAAAELPLAVVGCFAAAALVCHELALAPPTAEEQ